MVERKTHNYTSTVEVIVERDLKETHRKRETENVERRREWLAKRARRDEDNERL